MAHPQTLSWAITHENDSIPRIDCPLLRKAEGDQPARLCGTMSCGLRYLRNAVTHVRTMHPEVFADWNRCNGRDAGAPVRATDWRAMIAPYARGGARVALQAGTSSGLGGVVSNFSGASGTARAEPDTRAAHGMPRTLREATVYRELAPVPPPSPSSSISQTVAPRRLAPFDCNAAFGVTPLPASFIAYGAAQHVSQVLERPLSQNFPLDAGYPTNYPASQAAAWRQHHEHRPLHAAPGTVPPPMTDGAHGGAQHLMLPPQLPAANDGRRADQLAGWTTSWPQHSGNLAIQGNALQPRQQGFASVYEDLLMGYPAASQLIPRQRPSQSASTGPSPKRRRVVDSAGPSPNLAPPSSSATATTTVASGPVNLWALKLWRLGFGLQNQSGPIAPEMQSQRLVRGPTLELQRPRLTVSRQSRPGAVNSLALQSRPRHVAAINLTRNNFQDSRIGEGATVDDTGPSRQNSASHPALRQQPATPQPPLSPTTSNASSTTRHKNQKEASQPPHSGKGCSDTATANCASAPAPLGNTLCPMASNASSAQQHHAGPRSRLRHLDRLLAAQAETARIAALEKNEPLAGIPEGYRQWSPECNK